MDKLRTWFKNLSATRQFFVARTLYDSAIFVFDSFYMTYVFKESGDIKEVVWNIIVTLLTIFLGFVIGSLFINKLGVERNFKLSFFLYFITGIVGIFLAKQGAASYITISIVRGIAEGFYWVSANFIELEGLPHDSRSKYYSVSQSVNSIFYMVAPVALVFLLAQSQSLLPVYVLFLIFWIVALLVPFDFNINNKVSVKKENFVRILKSPLLKRFNTLKFITSTMWMGDWVIYAIVPYYLLGNEINLGIFLTASQIINSIVSYLTRKMEISKKFLWGWRLLLVISAVDFYFAANFTVFGLFLVTLVSTLTNAVTVPAEFDMNTRVTNKFTDGVAMGIEVNLYQEFVYTIARVVLAILLVGLAMYIPTATLLPWLIVGWVLLRIVNYRYALSLV